MAFGPGQAVIHNWLDDIIVSPWVGLAGTPGATSTVISFRRFGGNDFRWATVIQNWSVQSKFTVGAEPLASAPGGMLPTGTASPASCGARTFGI